jgi:large subunit ribosomal protein L28
VCGKDTVSGGSITRRGMAKKKGGVGKRITGRTKRVFKPNLQSINIIENGKKKKVKVCAKCLKANKIQKAA